MRWQSMADGCEYHPKCETCPLVACQLEVPGGLQAAKLLTAIEPMWAHGLTSKQIGYALGLSDDHIRQFTRRMVQRGYLKVRRQANGPSVAARAESVALTGYRGLQVRRDLLPALQACEQRAVEAVPFELLQSPNRTNSVCAVRDQLIVDYGEAGLRITEIAFLLRRHYASIIAALRRMGVQSYRDLDGSKETAA